MNLCMNSCLAIVLHIVLCCINLLPGTQRMLKLVPASFLMLRRAQCCSIQSTMRSVVCGRWQSIVVGILLVGLNESTNTDFIQA